MFAEAQGLWQVVTRYRRKPWTWQSGGQVPHITMQAMHKSTLLACWKLGCS